MTAGERLERRVQIVGRRVDGFSGAATPRQRELLIVDVDGNHPRSAEGGAGDDAEADGAAADDGHGIR